MFGLFKDKSKPKQDAYVPHTADQIEAVVQGVLNDGGPGGMFKCGEMTLSGVTYPRAFLASAKLTVPDLIESQLAERADKEYIVYEGERYTFGDIWAKSMRLANWLMTEKNVKPGDRVAIAMRNYPEWVIAYLGILATGAAAVPMNAWWKGEELRSGVSRADAKVVICDVERFAAIMPYKAELGLTLVTVRDTVPDADFNLNDIINNAAINATRPKVDIDPETMHTLMYTSGSTGHPKGVMLSHRSTVNSILGALFYFTVDGMMNPVDPETAKKADPNQDLAAVIALPLFHITALFSALIFGWFTSRKSVFMYKWDVNDAIKLIKNEKATHFVGVPTMAAELVNTADPKDLEGLRDITTAGAKRPETQVKEQTDKHKNTGVTGAYGLTETNGLAAGISTKDYKLYPGSAGRATPPATQIECLDDAGNIVPRGTTAEICIKSPINFMGYLNDEKATNDAFHDGGWFRTGDVGHVDEQGFIYITDRAKDLIIRGGENISCPEVENAVVSFDGVDEASAVAVPDEKLGEIVGVAVYSSKGKIDFAALDKHVSGVLAKYKVPAVYWQYDAPLPRGATGKTNKLVIREDIKTVKPSWTK